MRRAILFLVLLAILVGVILLLSKLKAEEGQSPSSSPDPTSTPVQSLRPIQTPAATASPALTPVPTASETPAEAPGAETPAPEEEAGEAAELTVYLEEGERRFAAFRREFALSEDPALRFTLVSPEPPESDAGALTFRLEPQGDGEGPAWLEFRLVAGTTAEELLPDFLSGYLRFTEIEFSGASALGGVRMDETVSAAGEGLMMKAWLKDVPQGVFAAVLCCSLDRLEPDQRYLEAMLETLTLTVEK